jgi:hypothetical protein
MLDEGTRWPWDKSVLGRKGRAVEDEKDRCLTPIMENRVFHGRED